MRVQRRTAHVAHLGASIDVTSCNLQINFPNKPKFKQQFGKIKSILVATAWTKKKLNLV